VLGDDYFRVAHHDVTGRPRLNHRVLSLGLAAALLGELLALRHVDIGDEVVVLDRRPPRDALAHAVLDEVLGEAWTLPVRMWLAFLADSAYRRVGERLARTGQVHMRRRWARGVTFVPTDMNVAAMPAAVLSQKVRRGVELVYDERCLAGLVVATGLEVLLLDGAPPEVAQRLQWAVTRLWPPMLRLLEHTQAAVGDAVLSHRT
jgi:Golgi phosphoprotein 3 GPP34